MVAEHEGVFSAGDVRATDPRAMTELPQAQLWLKQAQAGDLPAVSKLLALHHPALRAHLEARIERSLRARVEPEDILQQAYLAVYQSIDRFEDRGPGSFLNWILTIVDNKLADARRAVHRYKRDIARERLVQAGGAAESCFNLLEQLYADSGTPSRVVRRDEAVGALLASISRLSDLHRQVIQLRFIDGRPVCEVAEQVGKSEAAVVKLTQRALADLRRLMDDLGEFTRIS
jgi:RNA polymerase sigma-70 factor (ECF subfamily)